MKFGIQIKDRWSSWSMRNIRPFKTRVLEKLPRSQKIQQDMFKNKFWQIMVALYTPNIPINAIITSVGFLFQRLCTKFWYFILFFKDFGAFSIVVSLSWRVVTNWFHQKSRKSALCRIAVFQPELHLNLHYMRNT